MILSISDYTNLHSKHIAYIKQLSKKHLNSDIIDIGFLLWEDRPYLWSSEWDGSFVFYKIIKYDANYLKTIKQIDDEQIAWTLKNKDYNNSLNKDKFLKKYMKKKWSLETVSKEYPVKIYLCGTDDTSWSCFFSDTKSAIKWFEELKEYPLWEIIYDKCKFTN
jgi:hypothetical protein